MSTSGISANLSQLDSLLTSAQQFLSDFKQLGSDLKSGNISAAQQDFVTLSQDALSSASSSAASSSAASSTSAATSAATSASTSSSTGAQSKSATLNQEFQTLSQDLQSGDLSGAQQAYSQIAQNLQSSGGGPPSPCTSIRQFRRQLRNRGTGVGKQLHFEHKFNQRHQRGGHQYVEHRRGGAHQHIERRFLHRCCRW